MKIKAIIHPAEEGGYWAEVPALPGCITEGDTREEVIANLKDAIEGWLEVASSKDKIAAIAVTISSQNLHFWRNHHAGFSMMDSIGKEATQQSPISLYVGYNPTPFL
jgi:predicted RNase H-like HicB family nuclease